MDYYVGTLPVAKVMYFDFVDVILQNKKLFLLKTRKENYQNQIIVQVWSQKEETFKLHALFSNKVIQIHRKNL